VARREDGRPSQRKTRNAPERGSPKAAAARRDQGRGAATGWDGDNLGGGLPIVTPVRLGDVTIDGAQLVIERNGIQSRFTPAEWRLLCVFLRSPGSVLSREELAERAWGVTGEDRNGTVDVYISRVRRRLDPDGGRANGSRGPQLIQTVRHQGYRLVVEADSGQALGESQDSAAG